MRKLKISTFALILSAAPPALAGSHHVLEATATDGAPRPAIAEAKVQVGEQVRSNAGEFADDKGGISLSSTAERASQLTTGVKQRERAIILEQENR